jgi:hypothetical protein
VRQVVLKSIARRINPTYAGPSPHHFGRRSGCAVPSERTKFTNGIAHSLRLVLVCGGHSIEKELSGLLVTLLERSDDLMVRALVILGVEKRIHLEQYVDGGPSLDDQIDEVRVAVRAAAQIRAIGALRVTGSLTIHGTARVGAMGVTRRGVRARRCTGGPE